MKREDVRSYIPLLITFADGKDIQWFNRGENSWITVEELSCFGPASEYRVKPEPKLVPFTHEDREQLRDKWVKCLVNGVEARISCFTPIDEPRVFVGLWRTYAELMETYVFIDSGLPVAKVINDNGNQEFFHL